MKNFQGSVQNGGKGLFLFLLCCKTVFLTDVKFYYKIIQKGRKFLIMDNNCRICLSEDGIMLSVFDRDSDFNMCLSELILDISDVKVN